MHQRNVHNHVPSSKFLAPLTDMQVRLEAEQEMLIKEQQHFHEVLCQLRKDNAALPTHMRHRHLFHAEESLQIITDFLAEQCKKMESAISDFPLLARTVMLVDTKYREEAMRIIHQNEQLARRNHKLAKEIFDEIELSCSQMLTLH